MKLIKSYQINKQENNMTQQEYGIKDGHKWGQKHHKAIIHIQNIKIFIIICQQKKDNNLQDKHKPE
jgi:hypothetical protein